MSSSPLPYLCDGGGVGFRKTSKACNGQIDRLNNFEVTIIFQLSKYFTFLKNLQLNQNE